MALNETPQEPIISEEELKIPNRNGKDQEKELHLVALLGVLIIILILILAGLYLWSTSMKATLPGASADNMDEMSTTTDEEMVETINILEETTPEVMTATTSNDMADIEADLESTDMTEIDAELEAIDAELEAATQ